MKGTAKFGDQVAAWRQAAMVAEAVAAFEAAAITPREYMPSRIRSDALRYTDGCGQGEQGRPRVASLGPSRVPAENGHLGDLQRAIERGEIPSNRAYRPTDEERLIRELCCS